MLSTVKEEEFLSFDKTSNIELKANTSKLQQQEQKQLQDLQSH